MPPPRKVDLLPDEDRAWLDAELLRRHFCGYKEISALLAERGYQIGHASIGKYGLEQKTDFEERLARLKVVTHMSEQIPDGAERSFDKTNALALRDMIYELSYSADHFAQLDTPAAKAKYLNSLAQSHQRLSQSTVQRQKWDAEADAKLEALEKEAAAPGSGLDAETLRRVRQDVYGLAA